LARGEFERAEEQLAELVDRFIGMGSRTVALEAQLVRAEVASARGDFDRAMALVSEGEAFAGDHAGPFAARCSLQRAVALRGLGRFDESQSSADECIMVAREQSQTYEEALALGVRAACGRELGDEALAHAHETESARILAGLGVRPAPSVQPREEAISLRVG
jgi:ATP/maltotriose-dependent transcriptional regulator MalT